MSTPYQTFPTARKHRPAPCQNQHPGEVHTSSERHKCGSRLTKHSAPGCACPLALPHAGGHVLGPGQGLEVASGGSGVRPPGFTRGVHSSPGARLWAVHLTSLEPFGGLLDFTNHCGLLCSKHSPVSDCFSGKYDIGAHTLFSILFLPEPLSVSAELEHCARGLY